MDAREQRGLQIAATTKLTKTDKGYLVPSQTGKGLYLVKVGEKPACTCPDFESRHERCKHIYAAEYTIRREENADGTTTVTETVKVTYGQPWHEYNEAQIHEQEHFVDLLKRLCAGIPQPEQHMGRKRIPLADALFSATYKVYSTVSGRRFVADMRGAKEQGFASAAPSYASTARVLENSELTPILKTLIEQSAEPLKTIETDFAVDSTGFATSVYGRWYDHKYGKERTRQVFVKTHLMTGVKTNIVTTAEATITESADAPMLAPFVAKTAETFTINEVSADKAYSSRRNLHAVAAVDGKAFIPFKDKTNGIGTTWDALWNYMWAYSRFNRADFLAHYHKRSNVESTVWMIKSKMGAAVRSKTPTAQVNEVLCKVLAHNICVLIASIYELGITPVFKAEAA